MTYKGTNWTRGELGHAPPDPNPSIPCVQCDTGYNFQDYWEPRYVEPDGVDPHAVAWVCDECIERAKAELRIHKNKQDHRQLGEFA